MAKPLIVPTDLAERVHSIRGDADVVSVRIASTVSELVTLMTEVVKIERRLESIEQWLTKSSE